MYFHSRMRRERGSRNAPCHTVAMLPTMVAPTRVRTKLPTVWHGAVRLPRSRRVREWHYAEGSVSLRQGEEMGRFMLGSTVVLLFPDRDLRFDPSWQPGGPVRLGQAMAKLG